jgi:hypothetical protein
MKVRIGEDIEALCGRCGTSWHVIVAAVEQKIAKVECKQCGGVHRYRDSNPPARPARAAGGTGKKSAKSSKSAKGAAAPPRVEADVSKPVRPYAITASFTPGERIDHSVFGVGVVQRSAGPGRVEILFGDECKLLAQAKPASPHIP